MSGDGDRLGLALTRLESALALRHHPLLDFLRPGLPVEQVRSVMAATHRATPPAGADGPALRLPDAAVRLWAWRDGVDSAATEDLTRVPGSEFFPGGLLFKPLEVAVQDYLWSAHNFPWTDLDDRSPDWFPVAHMGHGDELFVDCAGPPEGRLIYRKLWDYNEPEDFERENLPSIADALDAWTALLLDGHWDVADRRWTFTGEWEPGRPSWY